MKLKTKAMLLAALALIVAFALCACGGKTAQEEPKEPITTETSSSSEASETTETSESTEISSPTASEATAPSEEKPAAEPTSKPATGKVLVAYFSQTGNTAPLAKFAAKALDADIFEIKAADPYTEDDLNYNDDSTRATVEQQDKSVRPAIAGELPDLGQYDVVVLAHPIWWGEEPRIMDTFVEGADLAGKTVTTLCTSGSSGIGSSEDNLAALADSSATWLPGKRFPAGASADEINAWLKEIGLL